MSRKQAAKNRRVAEIKSALPPFCSICGKKGSDAAHLLPKSMFPEWYTMPENIVILCRECHNRYDNDLGFRRLQKDLFNRICSFDKNGAMRYFRMYE
ncbi:MAG: HNH endonuclease [Chloroflexi bacterium]|nr:HNH endonuclease [Chloroflexota bacterium]